MPVEMSQPFAIVGNLNVDQIVSTVTRFPEWDEELLVDSSRLELAGTAGYLALAARGLGMTPFVVSTVGEDASADFLRRELAAAGIDEPGSSRSRSFRPASASSSSATAASAAS